jgi:hypothetical protein
MDKHNTDAMRTQNDPKRTRQEVWVEAYPPEPKSPPAPERAVKSETEQAINERADKYRKGETK